MLRAPARPVAPDPGVAARLRARIERALTLPKGVTPVISAVPIETRPIETSTTTLTPYLAVADARAAVEWYIQHLDARQVGEPIVMPDGRIGHAELSISGARVFLADEHPEIGVSAPAAG
ncbi:MAG: VOC family protein, partial [Solirubrobacteraceae bacterium]